VNGGLRRIWAEVSGGEVVTEKIGRG
jgi:hypothetical protein